MRAPPFLTCLTALIGCSSAACTGAAPTGDTPLTELAEVARAARTGGPEAEIVLLDALESDDPAVRLMAATARGRSERD